MPISVNKIFINNRLHKFKDFAKPLILLLSIYKLTNLKRKKQLLILSFLFILSSVSEVASIATILPLLSFFSNPSSINQYQFLNSTFSFLNISKDSSILILITLFFAFIIVTSSFLRTFTLYITSRISAGIGNDLSTEAFSKTIYQQYEVHSNRNSSASISTLTTEMQSTVNAVKVGLQLCSAVTLLIFIISTLFFLNREIAITSIFTFGLVYSLVSYKSSKKLNIKSKIIAESNKGLVKEIQEAFGGIKDIILDNNQSFYIKKYSYIDKKKRYSEADNEFIASSPYYILEGTAFIFFAFLGLFITLRLEKPGEVLTLIGTIALAWQRLLRAMQQIYMSVTVIKGRKNSIELVLKAFKQIVEDEWIGSEKDNLNLKKSI